MSKRRWRARIVTLFHDLERRAATSPTRWLRAATYLLRLTAQVVRQWVRDKCPQQAASLAFQTILSLVPIMAVLLAAFRASGSMDAKSAFVNFISQQLIAVSPAKISEQLTKWTENITFESLGLAGLISIGILSFIIFNNVEKTLNQIWRVERKRPLTQKIMVFYATVTIGPILVGTSLYQAAAVGLTEGVAGYFISSSTSFLAVFLAFYFLPAIKVRWRPAIIGALITTILFEVAKYGFNFYVTEFAFASYSGVYGAIASIPLLMIWIYYSWLMFLLGVEIAHAAQNIHALERMDRRQSMSLEQEILRRVNGQMAARVMVVVADSYLAGNKAVSRRSVADRFDLSDEVLGKIVDRLKQADLLLEVDGDVVGLLPARPPHEITLSDVLKTFRGADVDSFAPKEKTPLDEVLLEIEDNTTKRTELLTLDKLGTVAKD